LGEWFASLTPLWAESARQKQLTWETNIPEELPIIKTDPEHLAQVLDNLVSNAIKFTATPGKVSLSIHVDTGQIQFLVSDTGIGIPLEEQAQLFIPFHRVVQPGWKAPGLGLGLSIAKSITESLGGWISLSSVPGQGSTFIVTLSY
jgi:signal transduction histidine kinase